MSVSSRRTQAKSAEWRGGKLARNGGRPLMVPGFLGDDENVLKWMVVTDTQLFKCFTANGVCILNVRMV